MENYVGGRTSNGLEQSVDDISNSITEGEVLLGSVFESCDVNKDGKVRVSVLIEFLLKEAAADDNKEILGYLDDLSLMLDPAGKDVLVDKEMYQQGIRQWVKNIQERSNSFLEYDQLNTKKEQGDGSKAVYKDYRVNHLHQFTNGKDDSHIDEVNFSHLSESSNDWEKSQSEILGRIHELQVANKKLMDERNKLQIMVENTEETNTSLSNEIDRMRKKVGKCEQLLEKSRADEADFELLRNTVNEYQSTRDELLSKTTHLEKENQALRGTIDEYQKMDINKNTTLEKLQTENRDLLEQLNKQKQLYTELEALQDLKQKIVEESSSKSEYMTSFITELSMANEALKAEKNRLEVDLLESKHEISKLTAMHSPSRAIQQEPIHASTPFQRDAPSNLQQEINAELVFSDLSESPTSRSRSINNVSSKNSTNETDNSDVSFVTTSSNDKYSTVAQKIALSFKKKKELALKHIADLAASDPSFESVNQSKMLIKTWEEEMDSFAEKVQGLAVAKHVADKRSAKLLESLKKVTVKNQALTDSREKALQKIGDISLSSEEMEQRIAGLMEEVAKEKEMTENLRSTTEKLTAQLKEEKERNILLTDEIEELKKNPSLNHHQYVSENATEEEQQIKDLKSLVCDLETRLHDYTRRLFDLEEAAETKDGIIARQLEDIQELELSHSNATRKHEEELKEILEMFSNFGDRSSDEEEHEPLSLRVIKKRFSRYMDSLQAKLRNMGVRDGPVGSEGNDVSADTANREDDSAQVLNRLVKLPVPWFGSSVHAATQTDEITCRSICCGTDLGLNEVDRALNAFAMLKELQDNRSNSDASNSFTMDSNKKEDFETENSSAEKSDFSCDPIQPERQDNELENYGQNEFTNENLDSNTVAINNSFDDLLLKEVTDTEQKSPMIEDSSNLKITNDGDLRNTEALNVHMLNSENCLDDISDASKNETRKHVPIEEPFDERQEIRKHLISKKESHTVSKIRTRQDSVSTDDSNFSDEAVIEPEKDSRDSSPKHNDSAPESENSLSSNSSKRARRIGISAEPVRLPTWTELRESFKHDQQILLEEEIHSEHSFSLWNESAEGAPVDAIPDNVGHDAAIPDAGGADESMEWCYEYPAGNKAEGNASGLSAQEGSVALSDYQNTEQESKVEDAKLTCHSSSQDDENQSSASMPPKDSVEANSEPLKMPNATKEDRIDISDSIVAAKEEIGSNVFKSHADDQQLHSIKKLTELDKQLEKNYNNAVLAFRTDQYTLQKRLENQERARDVAETGMEREIRKLVDTVKAAELLMMTFEQKESIEVINNHTDVLRKAGMKVSAQAEQHGCFQQEFRSARIIDDIIRFAENLRLCVARAKEAEEMRIKELQSPRTSLRTSNDKDIQKANMKYMFCEKCNGPLTFGNDDCTSEHISPWTENTKETKKNAVSFFTLASNTLRERKKQGGTRNEIPEVVEKEFEEKETVQVDEKLMNYAANSEAQKDNDLRSNQPERRTCSCLATIFHFFLSIGILSAILFLITHYVEVDLTLLNKNWNDQIAMYGRKFFNKDNKNAI